MERGRISYFATAEKRQLKEFGVTFPEAIANDHSLKQREKLEALKSDSKVSGNFGFSLHLPKTVPSRCQLGLAKTNFSYEFYYCNFVDFSPVYNVYYNNTNPPTPQPHVLLELSFDLYHLPPLIAILFIFDSPSTTYKPL